MSQDVTGKDFRIVRKSSQNKFEAGKKMQKLARDLSDSGDRRKFENQDGGKNVALTDRLCGIQSKGRIQG